MVIVFVVDSLDDLRNGTVITAIRFADELRKCGHTVRILSCNAKGEDTYSLQELYVPVVTPISRKQGIKFAKFDESIVRDALYGADVVHLFTPFNLCKRVAVVAKEMNIPCTSAFHIQPENITYNIHLGKWEWLNKSLYGYFKKFYKNFTHIHCPTEFMAEQLRKNRYESKLHVISNGVSEDFCLSPDGYPESRDGKFNILMIGRLTPEKCQRLIIDAVNQSKHRERIQLYFAGSGPQQKNLEKQGEILPNRPEFNFYSKPELIERIRSCDLYVHAAEIESEAIACIEAFACGLVPIINNSVKSATKQFALDERSLFDGTVQNLAQKIDYLLDNPAEKQEMAEQYIELSKQYRLAVSVKKAEDMFYQALSEHAIKETVGAEILSTYVE